MNNTELIEVLESFKSGLIDRATGGFFDENDYKRSRETILSENRFKNLAPKFIKACRTTNEFWNFIQPEFASYKERRKFIADEINTMINMLEETVDSVENIDFQGIGERLGNGGFGQVYKYTNKDIDFDFAVKVFEPLFVSEEENKEGEKRFFRESKL